MSGGTAGQGPVMRPLKDRAEQALIEAYALDHLDEVELERRLDLVNRATHREELTRLLSDLPDPGARLPAGTDAMGSTAALRALGGETGWTVAPRHSVRPRQLLVGILGGASRKGRWSPAQHVLVTACMGGVDLDFRTAALPPGVTTVTVVAIMGGVRILVPPGVGVECGGVGIMGGFDATDQHPGTPDGPVIRVDGLAIWGGVEVKVSGPDVTKSERRLRRGGRE